METNNYIIEKNLIFSNFLEKHFFNKFREGNEHIEFFLKSQCPGKCAYCYLKKHGKDLYPYEYQDDELILNNLKLSTNAQKTILDNEDGKISESERMEIEKAVSKALENLQENQKGEER